MLEKPDLSDAQIVACVQDAYALDVRHITFLPLGADPHAAVYRVLVPDGSAYFVKVRRGMVSETSVVVPKALHDRGVRQVIAPLPTTTGVLWAPLADFIMTVYPFVEGHNGYAGGLSVSQWAAFGAALQRIHTAVLPPAILTHLQRETYSSHCRTMVHQFLQQVQVETVHDPIAVRLAELLRTNRDQLVDLLARADRLAQALAQRSQEYIVCHGDLHAGNLLLAANDAVYIVDWDTVILAPKERDLMFIGGGLIDIARAPHEEERLFYHGYGHTVIDPMAMAYFRYERIIQDIAAFCQEICSPAVGDADRAQALHYLAGNFQPGGVLDIAYRSDSSAAQQQQEQLR
jgi:spectinomycin phosphotransferase